MKKALVAISLLALLFVSAGVSRAGHGHHRRCRPRHYRRHCGWYHPWFVWTYPRPYWNYYAPRRCCRPFPGHPVICERGPVRYYPYWPW